MVWAILTGRNAIAYLTWTRINTCIHAALFACFLHLRIAECTGVETGTGEEVKLFERLAYDILDQFDNYEQAEQVLEWPWNKLSDWDAIKIARFFFKDAPFSLSFVLSCGRKYLHE